MATRPWSVATPLVQVKEVARVGRKTRTPKHLFNLATRPWQIQPFLIAPVLPGETMTNLLFQSRAVTDPLAGKLVGWFKEYYFFYVKLRDLDARDDLVTLLTTGTATLAATAATPAHYYNGTGYNFVGECLERVVDEFFRDDGEAITIATLDGLPLAAIDRLDWTQSLLADTATNVTDEELPGDNPSLPAHMSAFADQYAHWEAMRDMGLVAVTFEDWLHAMGVDAPQEYQEDEHRPELLRYVRQWTYPSNTIQSNLGTGQGGISHSAASWSIAERADKKRFFPEPGFIFGVTVARPKVYKSNLESAGANFMDGHLYWLPGVLSDAPYTSLRKFTDTGAGGTGPLATVATTSYWVDMRDLYLHGDQFVNRSFTADTQDNAVALPTSAFEGDYASSADADALFAASAANKIYEDGVVDLRILSAHATEDTSL